ncbi:hypothetical protein BDQ17DRAFT_1542399 [Cyathus striatus]|nr:hypothetical protein BDQ17DRAFT_1542399 [Cyathus striatus]
MPDVTAMGAIVRTWESFTAPPPSVELGFGFIPTFFKIFLPEIAFPILYLFQAVDAGVDPSNVILGWENQLVDRSGSLFDHHVKIIFLLAFCHANSVLDKTHLEDVVDAHVLKAAVKDILGMWEEFDVLSEDEMRAIREGVLNLYRATPGQPTLFPVVEGPPVVEMRTEGGICEEGRYV